MPFFARMHTVLGETRDEVRDFELFTNSLGAGDGKGMTEINRYLCKRARPYASIASAVKAHGRSHSIGN